MIQQFFLARLFSGGGAVLFRFVLKVRWISLVFRFKIIIPKNTLTTKFVYGTRQGVQDGGNCSFYCFGKKHPKLKFPKLTLCVAYL